MFVPLSDLLVGKRDDAQIISVIKGGIGNQLFIYAAGLALSQKLVCELVLDGGSGFGSHDEYSRDYQLTNYLDIVHPHTHIGYNSRARRLSLRLASRIPLLGLQIVPDVDLNGLLEVSSRGDLLIIAREKYVLDGYFQDWRIPDLVSDTLFYSFKKSSLDSAEREFHALCHDAENTAAVHLRRFERTPEEDDFLREYCWKLKAALDLQGVKQFVVFSEDVNLAQLALSIFGAQSAWAGSHQRTDQEEFFLISKFATIAITRSTFGWWAAWLGSKAGATKRVFASGVPKTEGRSTWWPEKMVSPDWIEL
jgi:hypothetical protein